MNEKKKLLVATLSGFAAISMFAVPVRWNVDISRIEAKNISAMRGETLSLHAQLTDRGEKIDTANASAQFFWQTNGMDNVWWQAPANITDDGLLEATFDASMDCGAAKYKFFIGMTAANDINYRASGIISLQSSPGASPTTVDLNTAQTINFAQVAVINAPWLTAKETAIAIQSATNALQDVFSGIVEDSKSAQNALIHSTIAASTNALALDARLAEKQDKLDATQNDAVNSGVTAGTVAQVAANLASISALAEIQKNYVTEDWVKGQGFLTSHQDLSGYATTDFVSAAINGIQSPSPDLTGYATEDWVKGQGFLTTHQDLTSYATKDFVNEAIDGIEIPVPDLTGYATEGWVKGQGFLTSHQDLSGYATTDFVSAAINGIQFPAADLTGYATEQWVKGQGFLTAHQDLTGYATESYVEAVVNRLSDNDEGNDSTTRLYALDGEQYIDGAGGIWQAVAKYAWLEDGQTTPFVPGENYLTWTNFATGFSLAYNERFGQNWSLTRGNSSIAATSASATNIEFVLSGWYENGEYHHTNATLRLSKTTYPGNWWIPAGSLARKDEVRAKDDMTVLGTPAYYSESTGMFFIHDGGDWDMPKFDATNGLSLWMAVPIGYDPEADKEIIGWSVFQDYSPTSTARVGNNDPHAPIVDFMNDQWGKFILTNVTDRIALESAFTNYYTKAELSGLIAGGGGGVVVETDPTVPPWAKDEMPPTYTAADVGAPSINEFEELKKESTLVYQLFAGSNIVAEVTNYNSAVHAPSLRLMRLGEDGTYNVVWTETNGLELVRMWSESNTLAQVSALETKANTTFAPKAWSKTTSGLGADAPNETTWISTPTMVIAGGLEFQKTITSSGQLWFLRSNGMTTIGKNNAGILDIAAADGKSIFTIEKTDSYLVGVSADSIRVNGNTVTMTLNVVSDEHPYLRYSPSLSPANWEKEEDGFISPVSVSWQGSSGAWICTVQTSASEGFFTFEFTMEGETKIKNGGVMDASAGILCTDGEHKCRPVYQSDGSVKWEVFK